MVWTLKQNTLRRGSKNIQKNYTKNYLNDLDTNHIRLDTHPTPVLPYSN